MGIMDSIRDRAKKIDKHIVLPEGADARIVAAAAKITQEGLAKITVLGDEATIQKHAADQGVSLDGIRIIDPVSGEKKQAYAEKLCELRKSKGMTMEQALSIIEEPMYYGTMMLKEGDADGLVGGALCTTADTIRPGLQIIKAAPGVSTISSYFVMEVPKKEFGKDGVLIFADCGMVIDPNEEQLADIAIASAQTARSLLGIEPCVAMLSFSTKGSAKHEMADKMINATKIAQKNAPDLLIDGELQGDAALIPAIAASKAPDSNVAGKANILIFPDINAGNIAYKLVQRLGGADAIGPLCQGFAKPINDLSRGCSIQDIVDATAMTVLQADA